MKPKLESQMNHLKQQMLVNQKHHQMKQKLVSRKLYATPQIYLQVNYIQKKKELKNFK